MDSRDDHALKRTRMRGVIASRTRLTHALTAAGLRSQSALAERMADIEGLTCAPRHLVNRVFRESPVDYRSLERVARALGVAVHTLYFTGADAGSNAPARRGPLLPPAAQSSPDPPVSPSPARRRRPWRLILAGCAGVVMTAMLTWSLSNDLTAGCELREWLLPPRTDTGRLGLVIGRFDNDPDNLGQTYLSATLHNDPVLMQHVSVRTVCRVFPVPQAGAPLAATRSRAAGQALLRQTGADVLIWGRVEKSRLRVRFVANADANPPPTHRQGQPLSTAAANVLEIPISLEQPDGSLAHIKAAALELMNPVDPALRRSRNRMVQVYKASETANLASAPKAEFGAPIAH